VIPSLEDIKALRKLEMVGEHVCHKFAFPLLHWRVGTEKLPASKVLVNGVATPEIDIADEYASSMAQEGYVVTSERHEIKILGAEGERLDMGPFIEHYEKRVIAGLRLSMMDLGRGDTANRGTATSLSKILVDACTHVQQRVASYMTSRLFDQLLMEGGFDLTDETRVHLIFPPIDTEEERAAQNHGMQLYVQGAITRAEMRQRYMNMDDLTTEEESNLHLYKHLIPLANAEAKAKAVTAAKKGKTSDAVKNRAQPANQHGTAPTAPRLPANDAAKAAWFQCSQSVISLAGKTRDSRTAFSQAARRISHLVEDAVISEWREGVEAARTETKRSELQVRDLHQVREMLSRFRQKDLQQLNSVCMVQANIEPQTGLPKVDFSAGSVVPAFSSTGVLLDSRVGKVVRAARLLGYLQAHKVAGTPQMKLADNALDLTSMTEDELPVVAMSPRLQQFAVEDTECFGPKKKPEATT
jgi:hypothetical protein